MDNKTHGGARKGAGAKPKPQEEKRQHVISFKVSDIELKQIDKNRGTTPRAEWIRKTITK